VSLTPVPARAEEAPVSSPPGWPRLDEDALYGVFGEFVRTVAPHTEADPSALLANALTMFGNCVGRGPRAMADASVHPAKLFVVNVGETSRGRKGTASAVTGGVFSQVDHRWWSERVLTGLASGEGLIAALRDPPEDSGATVDKRACIIEPEFARVTRVAAREANTLSPIIRSAWDSDTQRVMTRHDPLVATETHISIIGHVTTEEVRRNLSELEAANGFANRFLFVCSRRSQLLPSGGAVPDDDFLRIIRLFRSAVDDARRVQLVRRDPEAEELWRDLYVTMANTDLAGLAGAITSRAEAQVLRLSLTYALGDGARFIGVEHLRAAWAFWRYCEDSAAYIFGDALGDAVADKLLAALQDAGERGLSLTEQSGLFDRHVKKDDLDAARARLQARRRATYHKVKTGDRGRPVEFWFYCEREKEITPESSNGIAS
jgi:hypothetical protein